MFLISDNHSATFVMKFDVESYVKLMSSRSRRASLISSDLAALVKFFLLKNASIVSVKAVNQTSCPSKSAQSLAVMFFVAFFTFCEAPQCGHCTTFFPGLCGIFLLHVFVWQIMYMFSLSTNLNSSTEMFFSALARSSGPLILSRETVASPSSNKVLGVVPNNVLPE